MPLPAPVAGAAAFRKFWDCSTSKQSEGRRRAVRRSSSWLLSAVIHGALLVAATLPVAMAYVSDGCGSAGTNRYVVGMSGDRIDSTNRIPELFGHYRMDPLSSIPEDDAGRNEFTRWGFGPGDRDDCIGCYRVVWVPTDR